MGGGVRLCWCERTSLCQCLREGGREAERVALGVTAHTGVCKFLGVFLCAEGTG